MQIAQSKVLCRLPKLAIFAAITFRMVMTETGMITPISPIIFTVDMMVLTDMMITTPMAKIAVQVSITTIMTINKWDRLTVSKKCWGLQNNPPSFRRML